jgi:hypothetical protein
MKLILELVEEQVLVTQVEVVSVMEVGVEPLSGAPVEPEASQNLVQSQLLVAAVVVELRLAGYQIRMPLQLCVAAAVELVVKIHEWELRSAVVVHLLAAELPMELVIQEVVVQAVRQMVLMEIHLLLETERQVSRRL